MRHSIGNTRRVLQASVSAAAIALGSAAYADTYTLDQSWAGTTGAPNDLNLESLNEAIAAAVEGATARVDQTAVAQANSASAIVDIDALDIFAVDQGVNIGDSDGDVIWNQNAANVAGAVTVLGDALAGGSQIAAVSLNTSSIEAIGDTSVVNLTQFIEPFASIGTDLSLTATNAMVAGASFLGTAQIDGAFREFYSPADDADSADVALVDGEYVALSDIDDLDDLADGTAFFTIEKTFDDLAGDMNWVDEIQNSQQLAALSLNTASFLTNSDDLVVNLTAPQSANFTTANGSEPGFDNVTLQAENLAVAYAPQPLGAIGDPRIANLDQIAALTVNTLSFGEEDGTANYELNIAYDGSGSDWTSGQSFDATGVSDIFLYNTAVATTIEADAQADQTPTGYWTGLQGAYLEFGALFGLSIDSGIGDVTMEDGSQVAALTINSISNLSDGSGGLKIGSDSFIDVDDSVLASGAFEQSITGLGDFNSVFSFGPGDSVNQLFGSTLVGDVTVSDYEQIAVFQGNTLSSAGSLELGADFAQTVENVNLAFDGENGAYANNMAFSTDIGDINVDDVSQIAQTRMNSVSADEYTSENLTQTISGSTFNVLNAFDATVGSEGSVQVAGLEQIGVLQLNSASLGAASGGDITQDFASANPTLIANDAAANTDFGSSSLNNLNQVAFASINDVSSSSMTDLNVTQLATNVDLTASNTAYATVEVGSGMIAGRIASIDNATQTAFSRVNAVSVSVD